MGRVYSIYFPPTLDKPQQLAIINTINLILIIMKTSENLMVKGTYICSVQGYACL
jgi:hypothetical protein